ncbi:hypothetical protein TH63_12640 [Rufibacter radiotolerans]|uniref:SnoaL-like domain-containing protein n=1 Tax=Rufibacter radiotolerans TaxID=1379910 RepID=A0A0H4VQQ8_9BACT|nr:nuclear transport factor 2 family protein [Rufibacter radiotolerans]AKQ46277.1 hypothetical protein TH63_12640 [Rufibacter radiotolerans]
MKSEMVENYIAAYNRFDVDGMVANLAEGVVFKNVSEGKVNLELKGLAAFREQAEKAKALFLEREQKITALEEAENNVTVLIDYTAVLAVDFSPELKAGQTLNLKGKSIFTFRGNKITTIEDIT